MSQSPHGVEDQHKSSRSTAVYVFGLVTELKHDEGNLDRTYSPLTQTETKSLSKTVFSLCCIMINEPEKRKAF